MRLQRLHIRESEHRREAEERRQQAALESSLLQLNGLTIHRDDGKEMKPIIQNVSMAVHPGETVALVGESGSGKSITASAVLGMLPRTLRVTGGQILFQGENIVAWPANKRRKLCGKEIGFVLQDYQGSFTPFLKIGNQLVETIRSHVHIPYRLAKEMVLESLAQMGLPAERVFASYPFQLSGGQLQRAALAAVMMLKPSLLIADEPTTALDVLNGERVLDELDRLKRLTGCAVLMISHDLRQVWKRADHIAVMRSGMIVERGKAAEIREAARHPYTRMLLRAKPSLADIQAGHIWEVENMDAITRLPGGQA